MDGHSHCTLPNHMSHFRGPAYTLVISAITLVLAGCNLFDKDSSPTAPTSPTAPAPTGPIRYTALGASDAAGVGASVVCIPFTSCDNGTGYVPLLAHRLRTSREVTVMNLGIPGAVLSPASQQLAQSHGRDVPANIIDREMPFVPPDSTLVTIFAGGNDTNALGDAIQRGAAGSTDPKTYIETQVRAWGTDYDRLIRAVKSRTPEAFIIVMNVPNMAGLPYSAGYTPPQKQGLQAISVGFSREANRQAGSGVVVVDLMCDPQIYDRSRFASDGFHPNDAGHAYLAGRLLAVVNGATPPVSSSCSQMTLVPPL
jgi:lysophospholipase L1-like esterase